MKHKTLAIALFTTLSLSLTPLTVQSREVEGDTKSDKQENLTEKLERKSEILEGRTKKLEDKIAEKMEDRVGKLEERLAKVEDKKNLLEMVKEKVSNKDRSVKGSIAAINGTTFTVKDGSTTYTVTTDSSTKCQRHYWGECKISEIALNDKVNVWGTFTDDTKTTIKAELIRDLSIKKRHGTFIGDVVSMGEKALVLKSKERGEQKVTISTSTKIVMRNMKPSTFADIKTGHRLQVKGVWNKENSTITEVTLIKNFSLPSPKMELSTTPSVSPTTTVTPSVTSPVTN